MLSKKTLLQLLPLVDNPRGEPEKPEEEKQEGMEPSSVYQNLAQTFQTEGADQEGEAEKG